MRKKREGKFYFKVVPGDKLPTGPLKIKEVQIDGKTFVPQEELDSAKARLQAAAIVAAKCRARIHDTASREDAYRAIDELRQMLEALAAGAVVEAIHPLHPAQLELDDARASIRRMTAEREVLSRRLSELSDDRERIRTERNRLEKIIREAEEEKTNVKKVVGQLRRIKQICLDPVPGEMEKLGRITAISCNNEDL